MRESGNFGKNPNSFWKRTFDKVEKNAWVVFMTHSHYDVMTDEYMQTLAAAIDYCAEVGVDVVSAAEGLQAFNE